MWKAVTVHIMNWYLTFAWNFMDLFIIIISFGLTTRLEQINASLMSADGYVSETFT